MKIFDFKVSFRMPKGSDNLIWAGMIFLTCFGTLMVMSTSVGETYASDTVVINTIIKQLAFVMVSYLGMAFCANNLTMKWIREHEQFISTIGYLIVVLLFCCLLFDEVNGSKAWIRIGPLTLQPSEFMKTYIIVNMGSTIVRMRSSKLGGWDIIKRPLSFYILSLIAILFQKDLGSLLVLSFICAICLLIPGHKGLRKIQFYAGLGMLLCSCLALFCISQPGIEFLKTLPFVPSHVIDRFVIAADPWSSELGNGYQLINGLYAFATGGLFGRGYGQSIQKMAYVPEAQTDFILPIIVEEFGILGFVGVLVGYFILIFRLFRAALKTNQDGVKILYIGAALYLFLHFTLNIGGVSAIIPLTGVPLLFISAGSSSLLSIFVLLGICQANIANKE